jgi:hypothetical protein
MVIGDDPEDQLAPFDECIEIKPTDQGEVSEGEKQRMIKYYRKTENGKLNLPFDQLYAQKGNDWNGNLWKKHVDGTWHEYSTYNPDSKWDWYQLGGRWSGMIKLKGEAVGVVGEPSLVTENEPGIDQAKKGDIENLNELVTFAILKDGKWYERGDMGWWGMVSNEKDQNEWEEEIKKLLDGLPEDTLISIYDCHI